MIAGVMTLCCGADAPSALRSAELASGMPTTINSSATSRTDRTGHDQRAEAADRRHQRGHDRGRDRAAEEARKRVDRKRAAHPPYIHMRRQDRIVAGVIDAVGKPEQRGAHDQRGVAQMHAEHDQRQAADGKADQQHLARADMVGEIADRRLRQAGDHAEHGQRETELDIADAELCLQERKQHRQHEQMEMADPMGDRNRRQRAQRSCPLSTCCGAARTSTISIQNPVSIYGPARPGKGPPKIVARRLFVHEFRCMAAPARRGGSGKCGIKFRRQGQADAAMIRT